MVHSYVLTEKKTEKRKPLVLVIKADCRLEPLPQLSYNQLPSPCSTAPTQIR